MISTDVFQRFVDDSPVCVMVQALMENALSPTTVDLYLVHSRVMQVDHLGTDFVHIPSLTSAHEWGSVLLSPRGSVLSLPDIW